MTECTTECTWPFCSAKVLRASVGSLWGLRSELAWLVSVALHRVPEHELSVLLSVLLNRFEFNSFNFNKELS